MNGTTPQCKYQFADQDVEIGIDEAGRGPVLGNFLLLLSFLGPMVYGCCFWPVSVTKSMKDKYGFTGNTHTPI